MSKNNKEMKTALVTGASRGIGATVAQGLMRAGYRVALVARSSDKLELLQSEFADKALIFPIDVADEKAVQQMVNTIWSASRRIDVVFNNAGVNRPGTTEISYEDFDLQVAVNLRGAFNVLKATVPYLKQQGSGYIFNVSSIAGTFGFEGVGAYCATKFGLLGLSESLYRELAPLGIKVTALCPSWVNTDMAAHGPVPTDKMIQTDDIFKTVEYLLSLGSQASIKELIIGCTDDII